MNRSTDLHPEGDFLVALLSGRDRDVPEGARERIDWTSFQRMVPVDMLPILDERCRASPVGDRVPEDLRDVFRDARRRNAVAAVRRRSVMDRALNVLHARGLRVVLLKGAALVELAYADPSVRPMNDIDFWVRRDTIGEAVEALGAAQFVVQPYVGHDWAVGQPDAEDHVVLECEITKVRVELHAIPDPLSLLSVSRLEEMWERAEPLGRDPRIHVPHPQDLLLHVSLHASYHHRLLFGLRPLTDVRYLLDAPNLRWDWDQMVADWQAEGVAPWVVLALELASDVAGAPVPPLSVTVLPRDPELEDLAYRVVLSGGAVAPGLVHSLAKTRSWKKKGALLWARASAPYRSTGRTPVTVREVFHRVAFDLRIHLGKYLKLWSRGELKGEELRRRADLARAEEEIVRRMVALAPVSRRNYSAE